MEKHLRPVVWIRHAGQDEKLSQSLVSYLNKFFTIPISIQRQDGNGHLYRLDSLSFRFALENKDSIKSQPIINKPLTKPISSPQMPTLTPPDIPPPTPEKNNSSQLSDYLTNLIEDIGICEHETFLHPVAVVNILTPAHPRPAPITESHIYVNYLEMVHFYLVLDVNGSHQLSINEFYESVKLQYGIPVHMLQLSHSDNQGFFGNSANDSVTLLFLREFAAQHVIPFMDRFIQNAAEQYVNPRKGITGRLFQVGKRYFGSGSASSGAGGKASNVRSVLLQSRDGSESHSIKVYPSNAPESMVRRLADFAFMLRDYKFAASAYDIVKKDYQSDRAFRHYAGVQEMIGLCNLLTKDRRDVDNLFESAITSYLSGEMKDRSVRDILRCALLYHEVYWMEENYKDASRCLQRIINELPLNKKCVLYEQIAYCFSKNVALYRNKYGFFLYLAACSFLSCEKLDDAFRCLTRAAEVYNGKESWTAITEEINYLMAFLLRRKGKFMDSLNFAVKLLKGSECSPPMQQGYMNLVKELLLDMKQEGTGTAQLPEFSSPVPIILQQSFRFEATRVSNVRTQSSHQRTDTVFLDDSWKSLQCQFGQLSAINSSLTSFALGELIFIKLSISNPLKVPLRLENARFVALFSHDGASFEVSALKETTTQWHSYQTHNIEAKKSIFIDPEDTVDLEWELAPQKPGTLSFEGIEFEIDGVMPVRCLFDEKKRDIHRVSITPPMPKLEILFDNVPSTLMSGELQEIVLIFRNVSKEVIERLSCVSSHPTFFSFGDSKQVSDNSLKVDTVHELIPHRIAPLKPGQQASIPIFMRADKVGSHVFQFLFSYSGQSGQFRFSPFSFGVEIKSSLKVSAFSKQSADSVDHVIVGLEVENLSDMAISIERIDYISSCWEVVDSRANNTVISSGQIFFTYQKLLFDSKLADYQAEKNIAENLENLLLGNADVVPTLQKSARNSFSNNHLSNVKKKSKITHYHSILPVLKQSKLEALFPCTMTNDLDVIVNWSLPSMSRKGQTFVPSINLGPALPWIPSKKQLEGRLKSAPGRSLYEQTENEKKQLLQSILYNKHIVEDCPIRAVLVCDDVIYANFTTGIATIRVQFSLRNFSWFPSPVRCKIELFQIYDSSQSFQDAFFTGKTSFEVLLHPNSFENAPISFCCTRPGLFDLNKWKIIASYQDRPEFEFEILPSDNFLVEVREAGRVELSTSLDARLDSPAIQSNIRLATPTTPSDLISF